MSIIIDQTNRVCVLGATGQEGSYWTSYMKKLGTDVSFGSTPKKEGQFIDETIPVYNTVARGQALHHADTAMLFVPPRFTRDAVIECLESGIKTIVTVAEGIPLHETLELRAMARHYQARIYGGNTSGIISPGKAMLGMFPYWIERVYTPGTIGVMTRSGSLTNEVTAEVVAGGFGVSTLVGIGGDPVPMTRFAECLPLFEKDPDTEAVVIIGELGGTMEEEVAQAIDSGIFTKPLVAFIGGRTAPKGKRMGHAGAIVTGGRGTVASKITALEKVGAKIAGKPSQVGELLKGVIETRGIKMSG